MTAQAHSRDAHGGGEADRLAALEAELERVRWRDEVKGRILEVLGRVTAQNTVDGVCRAIVEEVRSELAFDRVGLFIWDDEISWFRGSFGTGLNGETTDERHIVWNPQPEYAEKILGGATFIRGCILGEPLAQPGEEGITADLVVLRREGHVYGVLSVDNRLSRRPISMEELQPLTLLSRILGNSVDLARARSALADSEERFREVAQNSREWIWETDSSWRYTYSSPAVEDLLGYTAEEVLGRTFDEFASGGAEGRAALKAQIEEFLSRGEKIEAFDNRQQRRDGAEVVFETFAIPVRDRNGVVVGYRGAHRDMTRERELEAQLIHAQKLEAIGRLAGGIAHDFNNILTSILGVVSMLLDELAEGDPIRGEIDQIRQAGERAAKLTRQLLAFSRRQLQHKGEIDAAELVRQMEDFLRRVIGEEIELEFDVAESGCRLQGDAAQLRQVILELAVNARDAMLNGYHAYGIPPPPRGRVRRLGLQVRRVDLSPEFCRTHPGLSAGPHVLLKVSDTGPGIPESIRGRIFDPFYTTREVGRGSGLGLSSVYGIVTRMAGHIEVESVEGEGTTFSIYLPCAHKDKKEDSMHANVPEQEHTEGRMILLVEDEEPIRRLMARMLETKGYRTLQAEDGEAALRLGESYPGRIDLVITDMVMPRMTGKQLVEGLRRVRSDFSVLFVSGYASEETVDEKELGTRVGFVQKPFTQEVLALKVEELIGGGG